MFCVEKLIGTVSTAIERVKHDENIKVHAFYFAIAAAVGLFLLIKCGIMVGILAVIGGIIALLYARNLLGIAIPMSICLLP